MIEMRGSDPAGGDFSSVESAGSYLFFVSNCIRCCFHGSVTLPLIMLLLGRFECLVSDILMQLCSDILY